MYGHAGDPSKLTYNQVQLNNVADNVVALVTSRSANTQDVLAQLQRQLHFQQV